MRADTIIHNAQVYTVDRDRPTAEAAAVLGDRILAVGTNDDILTLSDSQTNLIDAAGRTVLPGVNDNHLHPPMLGMYLSLIDASPRAVRSILDIQRAFRTAAEADPTAEWLRGRGYDDTRLAEHRHPTRYDLDEAVGGRPAYLVRTCGHIGVANSAALRFAGVTRDTPNPTGGEIDRDEHGEPNGVLRETAQQLVTGLFPEPTVDDIKGYLRAAGEEMNSYGITSAADASIRHSRELLAYQELRKDGELPFRTYTMMLIDDTLDDLIRLGISTGFGDEWLRIGPAKIFQDGSGGGRTALMSAPYPDQPDNYGIAIYSQDEIDEKFTRAAAAGFQCTAHAIGDRAIDMIITGMERALAAHPIEDHRWRVEHCGLMTDDLFDRMQNLGLIAVPQFTFVHYLGDSYIENFTRQQLELSYPARDWIDRGILTVASTDAPVTPVDPWVNLRAAVTRMTQDGQLMGPEQGVTVDEALEMMTLNGARASFEEQIKGSITPGKLADLIIVDQDPHDLDPTDLHQISCDLTMIGGSIVFERT